MKWSYTLLAIFYACTLSAQIITVRDAATDEPVEGAQVSGLNGQLSVADAAGQVDISSYQGQKQISIFYFGYETYLGSYEQLQKQGRVLLQHDQLSLDEIVVSANRWEQNKSEVPNKITALRKKDILYQNPQTAADLLGISGEVFIQKSQYGGGSPMIRGFSTNRLLYTVDGVRMNTAIFRSGNLHNVISLDPLAMERSEVIFGPGSVIYGSDAIGGVMNFYTLEPHYGNDSVSLNSANIFSRFASASNEVTGHFDVGAGGKNWASVTSFSYSNFGDLKMGKNGPDEYLRNFYVKRVDTTDVARVNTDPRRQVPSGFQQASVMQKFKLRLSESWEAAYGFHYSTTGDFPRYDRLLRTRNGSPRSAEWYYGPQKWMMNHLKLSHRGGRVLYDEMSVALAYQRFEESRHDRDFNDFLLNSTREQVDAYSINVDFEKGEENPHRFFYGAEFVFNEVESSGSARDIRGVKVFDIADRYPQADWMSYGVYLSYELVPNEQWAFHAGSRYTGYGIDADFSQNSDFFPLDFQKASLQESALTGNFGLVYSPASSWKLSLNLSSGFRAPNVDDMGKIFDSEPGAVVVPNPDLAAEYAYNIEAGLAKVFGRLLKLDLTGYYTYLDDALVRRPFTLNGVDSIMYDGSLSQVQAVQNAAFAEVYGVQAGATLRLPAHLTLSSDYTWQKGREETDDGSVAPSRHAAPAFGNTHLVYNHHQLRLDLYADYCAEVSYDELATSERDKNYMYAIDAGGNPYSPAWYTINFKAGYQLTEAVFITAGLENITNQRYKTYSSGLVAPGLNFIASARMSF